MQMSKDLLNEIHNRVKENGIIDDKLIQYLDIIFPNKSQEILEAIRRGITIYIYKPSNRKVWIAMGQSGIYLIYPKIFCSCQDFYKSVIIDRKRGFCKHILAQIIVDALDNYQTLELEDSEFIELMEDLRFEDKGFGIIQ